MRESQRHLPRPPMHVLRTDEEMRAALEAMDQDVPYRLAKLYAEFVDIEQVAVSKQQCGRALARSFEEVKENLEELITAWGQD